MGKIDIAVLTAVVVCITVAGLGCGGSGVVGVYRLYNPPLKTTPGYSLVRRLRLELKSNGTYVHTTYDQSVPPVQTPTGPETRFIEKTYRGTYTIDKNAKGGRTAVILNGEPDQSNPYYVYKLGLVNALGLWAKKPPPGTK